MPEQAQVQNNQSNRKIMAVTNQKGGVGKTTTTINLAASLAAAEKKILLVDIDPQGNATSGLGINKDEPAKTVYHLLLGEASADECVQKTPIDHLDLIPANVSLAGAEVELVSEIGREFRLAEGLAPLRDAYDLILIDCPPSLGILTLNGMVAADRLLIPLQCEYYALEGLSQLLRTVRLVQERLNPRLEIDGVLLTMFDARTALAKNVRDDVVGHLGDKVYQTSIPRNVRLSEAPGHGLPVLLYDPTCKGAEAYLNLAKEVMNHGA